MDDDDCVSFDAFSLAKCNLVDHLRVDEAWVFEGSGLIALVVLMSCQLFGRSHPLFSFGASLHAVVDDTIQSKSTYSRPVF